jgi:hypothetical protein
LANALFSGNFQRILLIFHYRFPNM